METPDTLRDGISWSSDLEHRRQSMVSLRWAYGIVKCQQRGSAHVACLSKNRIRKCCGKHESPTVSPKGGAIFEDSPIPLEKWLTSILPGMVNHARLGKSEKSGAENDGSSRLLFPGYLCGFSVVRQAHSTMIAPR